MTAEVPPSGSARPGAASAKLILAAVALVVLGQGYLIFVKCINWDEFFHLSLLHDMQSGRMFHAFQTLYLRMFSWVPLVTTDVIGQVQIVRLAMLAFELVAVSAIFGLARRFVSVEAALLTCLAYVGGGSVFLHAFSLRSDPIATGMLMSALWLALTPRLRLPITLTIAVLIGLSGAVTVKSALYLPCFAGIAWWRHAEAADRWEVPRAIAMIAVVAPLVFALAILLHSQSLAPQAPSVDHQPLRTVWSEFFAEGMFAHGRYVIEQIVRAPVLAAAIGLAPLAWRRCEVTGPAKVALWGLLLPLLSLVVYRNTFPYFFVFLLAPVVVAAAPAFEFALRRYDWRFVVALLLASPLVLIAKEPREYLGRQRALVDYIHQTFPPGTPYLSYAGIIADYPRILPILTSGVGITAYHRNGEPIVARAIRQGGVPFIIADHEVIRSALAGHPIPGTFLSADVAAMHGNYVRFWGPLWLEGKQLIAGTAVKPFEVDHGGPFVLAGGGAMIDGRTVRVGDVIELEPGTHTAASSGNVAPILWRGTEVPKRPVGDVGEIVYSHF